MTKHCECCHRPTSDCEVMRELVLYRTPEGRAQLRAEYQEQLRRRAAERESGADRPGEAFVRAQRAGCPVEALLALRSNVRDTKALEAAKRFCREGRAIATFLVLLGNPGVGKTVAATYVALDFARGWAWNEQPTGQHFEPLMYVRAATLTSASAFDDVSRAHFEAMQECRLLVLEDAGDEATKFGTDRLVELLMSRHERKRRTVLCSNVTGAPFVQRYGQAVADRLKASGIVPNLQHEKSLRGRAA